MLSSRSGRTPSRPVNSRWDPPSEQAAGAPLAQTHPAGTTVLERRPSAHTRAGDQIQMNLLKSRALTLLAATALAATACQGAKGIDGANGAAGTTGASGANGTNGTDGGSGANGASGTNGTSGVNGGQTTGLVLALTGAPTINADQSVTIRFTAKDDQGFPVDLLNGKYSLNTPSTVRLAGSSSDNVPRFAIAQVNQAAGGSVLPYNVLTASGSLSHDPALPAPDPATVKTSPSAFTPSLTTPNALTTGILVENPTGA